MHLSQAELSASWSFVHWREYSLFVNHHATPWNSCSATHCNVRETHRLRETLLHSRTGLSRDLLKRDSEGCGFLPGMFKHWQEAGKRLQEIICGCEKSVLFWLNFLEMWRGTKTWFLIHFLTGLGFVLFFFFFFRILWVYLRMWCTREYLHFLLFLSETKAFNFSVDINTLLLPASRACFFSYRQEEVWRKLCWLGTLCLRTGPHSPTAAGAWKRVATVQDRKTLSGQPQA